MSLWSEEQIEILRSLAADLYRESNNAWIRAHPDAGPHTTTRALGKRSAYIDAARRVIQLLPEDERYVE